MTLKQTTKAIFQRCHCCYNYHLRASKLGRSHATLIRPWLRQHTANKTSLTRQP